MLFLRWHHNALQQLQRQREQAGRSCSWPENWHSLLQSALPDGHNDVRRCAILAIDFETTGLDASKDQVLSMGWVTIRNAVIDLQSARHVMIKPRQEQLTDTVRYHQLRPEILQRQGVPEDDAFALLCAAMAGKLLLAHGTVVEQSFINAYLQRHCQTTHDFPLLWLDSLKTAQYIAKQPGLRTSHLVHQDWRLASLRQAYGLPAYANHHALVDAIAAAELWLAEVQQLFAGQLAPLQTLYRASVG